MSSVTSSLPPPFAAARTNVDAPCTLPAPRWTIRRSEDERGPWWQLTDPAGIPRGGGASVDTAWLWYDTLTRRGSANEESANEESANENLPTLTLTICYHDGYD